VLSNPYETGVNLKSGFRELRTELFEGFLNCPSGLVVSKII
jgi:hypothetical protein